MEWEFGPVDVVKGAVGYTLAQFRRDLAHELRANLETSGEDEFQRAYGVVYDLCYWLATGHSLPEFLSGLGDDPTATRLAMMVHPPMAPNIEMLGAILQRMIMDGVEAGLPLDDAVAAAEREHRAVAGAPPRDPGRSM
jgi:hypothetical protein